MNETVILLVLVDVNTDEKKIKKRVGELGITKYGISSSCYKDRPHELFFWGEKDAISFTSNFIVQPLKDGHLYVPFLPYAP